MKNAERAEAAAILRRLLVAVDQGEVTARPAEVHRMEGAVTALEASTPPARRQPAPTPAPWHGWDDKG